MLLLLILTGTIIIAFWRIAIKPLNYWKSRGVKQGNPVWLFGDVLRLLLRKESFPEFIERLYKQCPGERYSGMYQLTIPTLLIHDPDLIKQILVKDFDHFVDHRTIIPEETDPLWGKNLFALKGDRWKEMRPILSPQFTSGKMKSIFLLMTDCVEVFMKNLSKENEGKTIEVEMRETLARFGIDVIGQVAFGLKVNTMLNSNNEFYLMAREATDLNGLWINFKFFGYQIVPRMYKILQIFNIRLFSRKVTDFFENTIEEIVRLREEKRIESKDLIQLLLDAKNGIKRCEEKVAVETGFAAVHETVIDYTFVRQKHITNADIVSQTMIFFLGGFEPVTGIMSFMTYELALNPDVQNKLRKEILETRSKCGDKVTYEALMQMKYSDMVVTETLRKWPQGIQLNRVCTKPYTIEPELPHEKPVHLKPGDQIWVPVYGIHHDPKYYPDPEKFDPERFNDENKHKLNPYLYIPFGVGPRNCIGSRFALLEVKTLMFYLLANYEVVPTDKTTIPEKIARGSINVQIEGGFHVGLKPMNAEVF